MKAPILATLFSAALLGCSDGPTSPLLQTSVASLFAEPVAMEVGELLLLEGELSQGLFLDAGADGAEYLLVPFNASDAGAARLAVEILGGNVQAPSGSLASAARAAGPPGVAMAEIPDREEFHERLREWEVRELSASIGSARSASSRRPLRAALEVPRVGALLPLNVPTGPNLCATPNLRVGRVVAVTEHAIVVADTANPPSDFTDQEFAGVAATFDTLVYPVDVRNFGEPTDIDDNSRVILFYTREVNELTPADSRGLVGGFFFSGDLFPPSACAASNFAEIFYLLAPDPQGVINNNVRTADLIRRSTLGTVGHELQHLINSSRRIYINMADAFEEVWLNEGLSHIAEELLFYEASGLEPRQNIDLETLRGARERVQAVNTFQVSNLARYASYLENPDTTSLLGVDELPTRGASWAFLRYAADQETGPDQPFWFDLVNSTEAGVDNLRNVLGGQDPIDVMQAWTTSVFTDDFPGLALSGPLQPTLLEQPSWNFRSILPVLDEGNQFPLAVRALTSGAERAFTLRPGGAVFIRFGIAAGQQAVLTTTSGGAVPPERLRISVVRLR